MVLYCVIWSVVMLFTFGCRCCCCPVAFGNDVVVFLTWDKKQLLFSVKEKGNYGYNYYSEVKFSKKVVNLKVFERTMYDLCTEGRLPSHTKMVFLPFNLWVLWQKTKLEHRREEATFPWWNWLPDLQYIGFRLSLNWETSVEQTPEAPLQQPEVTSMKGIWIHLEEHKLGTLIQGIEFIKRASCKWVQETLKVSRVIVLRYVHT